MKLASDLSSPLPEAADGALIHEPFLHLIHSAWMPGKEASSCLAMPFSARDTHRAGNTGFPFCAILLSLFLAAAHADEAYQQGIDAFNQGDYEAAIDHFLATHAEVTDSMLLHYNLGVSYYKLGRYHEAGASFLRVTADPELAALGYYNLALVYAHLDQPEQVIAWLQRAIETADNPKLSALAQTMLAQYTAGEDVVNSAVLPASDITPPASPWSGFIAVETGYDDNVILLSDSQTLLTSKQDDLFLDTFAYIRRQFRETDSGLQASLEGTAYAIKYQEIVGYDIDSLSLGGVLGKNILGWAAASGVHLTYALLEGNDFTFEPQISVSAHRWLVPDRSQLRLRFEVARIDSRDPLYNYLEGWRYRTDARMTWMRGGRRFHAMYQFEANHREELETPLFTSYSPIRNSLRLGADIPVRGPFDAAIEVQYHHSHFLNPNELAGGGTLTRSDDRLGAVVRITRRFGGETELSLEYRRNDNNSNIDDYDYTQYIVVLGVLVAF